ncbi:MAG: site-specific integrase [candidate division Zixibacteria bacterium]|nr:site-specific integrase [candidate division Zixibacteria bacterium]
MFVRDTKNAETREIPINNMVVQTLINVKSNSKVYVFCNKNGRPFHNVRQSFTKALREAGINDFRFHDLRHTFASHLVMAGVDLLTVKELLGHKKIDTTLRYSHLSPSHKRSAIERLAFLDGHQYGHQGVFEKKPEFANQLN